MVKYFAFTALLAMLLASLVLAWMVSNNARTVLLKRSEAYSQLFADNLNRQVFLQFVLPTVVRYGRIALADQNQYARLDRIVLNVTRGMRIDSVTIFDSKENRISYSTQSELKGKRNMGGLEYKKALEGETSTVIVYGGSLLSLIPGMPKVYCTLKTYVPFRQEDRLGMRTGEIMGVVEVTQDLSEDLEAIILLQARIIITSLVIMAFLFSILSLIVVRANRIMAKRAEERIILEEQLNESQRLASLGKMVAAVSHEIKNPLGIVRSTAEVLKKRISKIAPGNEHLAGIIVEETSRLDRIVREFLDFARPQEGAMKADSINPVVERVARFMESEIAQKDIELILRLSPNLPDVFMDGEQIYQVLFNIMYNAVQAMPEGGILQLHTSLEQKKNEVRLSIEDTGIGIKPENLEQVFTPFYTDKSKGTGLGLAIAKNIVDKHNGSILVNSIVDKGSQFIVSLPVHIEKTESEEI
ncbi:two-component system sensor histidine kinase NtrB [Desulfogranum japonicum]|uniref:two-component system sensor histidine kinase NtrB n=1 Tax=Desulfogranum japonicum TaxID=231447 RepID=UPI001E44B425|nr:ATP-binding protein [Desulfogranum japonicum]